MNELDPTTGTSKGGIGATLKSAPKEAPKKLSAQDEDVNAPAVPEENQLPSYDSNATEPSIESIPTPEPTGAGVIRMLVPEDSVVYVNGYRTKQSGETRTFAAKNLKYGETYEFEIRVVAVRNGQTVEDVQTAVLTAGEKTALAFNPKPRRANEAIAFNK